LPWLTTGINGGGWANAIGGSIGSLHLPHGFGPGQLIVLLSSALLVAGAMVGRGLSVKSASSAALGHFADRRRAHGVVLQRQRQAAGIGRLWACMSVASRRPPAMLVFDVGVGGIATRPIAS